MPCWWTYHGHPRIAQCIEVQHLVPTPAKWGDWAGTYLVLWQQNSAGCTATAGPENLRLFLASQMDCWQQPVHCLSNVNPFLSLLNSYGHKATLSQHFLKRDAVEECFLVSHIFPTLNNSTAQTPVCRGGQMALVWLGVFGLIIFMVLSDSQSAARGP